jgi:hypothetical protein
MWNTIRGNKKGAEAPIYVYECYVYEWANLSMDVKT